MSVFQDHRKRQRCRLSIPLNE